MNSSSTFPAPPVEIFVDTRGAKIMEDGASHPDQRDSRDIYLPNHIEAVSHIAVDVGGSLAKVVYFTRTRLVEADQSTSSEQSSAPLHLNSVPSSKPRILSPKPSVDFHSRPGSHVNGNGTQTPPVLNDFAVASGALTPTAIFGSPLLASASAIHSTLLKRRSLPDALPGGRLNFVKFETSDIHSCIAFLRELIERSASANKVSIQDMRKGVKLMATGGGAHLMYDLFESELGIEVQKEEEMACLITGLNFITLIPDEVFWYSDELVAALHSPLPVNPEDRADAQALRSSIALQHPLPRPSPNPPLYAPVFDSHPSPKLPCLLVNIGSGVSIIKVDDFGKFERVSGTSLGGGTLWGLLSLLTDAESFDEMLELSEQGDNSTVDMLVGDIYGSVGYNNIGLKSSTIASSFGKVFRKDPKAPYPKTADERRKKFRPEDICKSLLYAISNNIGQIAYMNAEKYNLDRIYFGGCFIRGHQATISTLSYAIRFWSKNTKRAFFLRHEGYLGSIGAWIKHVSRDPNSSVSPRAAATAAATMLGMTPSQKPGASADSTNAASESTAAASTTKTSSAPALSHKTASDLDFLNGLLGPQLSPSSPLSQRADIDLDDNNRTHSRAMNDSSPEGNPDTEPVDEGSSGTETAQLNEILAALSSLEIPTSTDPAALAAAETERDAILGLLANLDQTEEVVEGLESRLDKLLSSLDGMIAHQDAQKQAAHTAG